MNTKEVFNESRGDPIAVFRRAIDDRVRGSYAEALTNHVLFRRIADPRDERQRAYVLSYGLVELHRLSEVYAPAEAELKRILHGAQSSIRRGVDVIENFHSAAAILRIRRDLKGIVDLFMVLHKRNDEATYAVYGLAQRALIAATEFKVCGKYLQVIESEKAITEPLVNLRYSALRPSLLKRKRAKLVNRACDTIALYVVNGRAEEADHLATCVKGIVDDSSELAPIEEALKGRFTRRNRP